MSLSKKISTGLLLKQIGEQKNNWVKKWIKYVQKTKPYGNN